MVEKIFIIILVNILFYLKTWKMSYVSDDIVSSQRTPHKNPFIHYFWVIEGRLKSVSYKKMAQGISNFLLPSVDHAITTIIHSLVCVGIYLGFGSNEASFIAALLFSFNPINNQGSVWISGRGYALSALGMVWALALPMEMGGLMLLGATYSNAGFFMPLVLIGSNHPYLILFAPLCWMFHVKNFKKNVKQKMDMEIFTEDAEIHPKKLILGVKTFGIYLSHALIPFKTTFYHSYLESIAGCKAHNAYSLCKFFWFGLGSLLLMAWYMLTHRWDMICFGILWWCVGIAPFCNLMRMQQELGERYVYVANVGCMVILAQIISPYPYLIAGFITMYAVKTWFFIDAYKDDFWMIEHCRIAQPKSWFAWHISAVKRWDVQSYREAVLFWVMARNLSPKEFKLSFNLAAALVIMGNQMVEPHRSAMIKEGLGFLAEAQKNIPRGQEKMAQEFISNFRKNKVCILI